MLAINGGEPFITQYFSKYNPIQAEEISEAAAVLKSGTLSDFLGASGSKFLGGKYVQALEETTAQVFGSKYCVSFNSWTSGLTAIIGSIPDLNQGDEIITSPWTMSATATAILQVGAIPVFADISSLDFQMTEENIVSLIGPRTRGILAVDIFGRSSNYKMLKDICNRYNLYLFSDSAQAPGAKFNGKYITQYTDVGGYSLNYHKHIHSGEGGLALTDNEEFAKRMRLIRNHAESVVTESEEIQLQRMIGNNYRLGEIEASIARPQIKRIDSIVEDRIRAGNNFVRQLSVLPHIKLPELSSDSRNVFYILPIIYNPVENVSRDYLVKALTAEGVPGLVPNYTNIHRLPLFSSAVNEKSNRFPWSSNSSSICFSTYGYGACPVAEELFDLKFFGLHICSFNYSSAEIELVVGAFKKVWQCLGWIE